MALPDPVFCRNRPEGDLVQRWIDGPREMTAAVLRLSQEWNQPRIEIEYGRREEEMLARAYGCTTPAPAACDAFRDLLHDHGADISEWKPPATTGAVIQDVVLPLVNYLNLSHALELEGNWDRGLAILREVNPKLGRWLELESGLSAGWLGSSTTDRWAPEIYREWSDRATARAWGRESERRGGDRSRDSESGSNGARDLQRDYSDRLRGEPEPERDRSVAMEVESLSYAFKRELMLKFDAVALGPGNIFDGSDWQYRDSEDEQLQERQANRNAALAIGLRMLPSSIRMVAGLIAIGSRMGEGNPVTAPERRAAQAKTAETAPKKAETTPTRNEFFNAARESRSEAERRREGERQDEVTRYGNTACVSPNAELEMPGRGVSEEARRKIALRFSWSTRFGEKEEGGLSAEEFVRQVALRRLAVINFRPDRDDVVSETNIGQLMAEMQATIDRLVNPGRDVGG